jgi:hypothetical protein
MLLEKMDRSKVICGSQKLLDEIDKKYWENASVEEKLETITYLRECFYGKDATTGRLQRVYTVSKLKQC